MTDMDRFREDIDLLSRLAFEPAPLLDCPLCEDGVVVEGVCDTCGESTKVAHEIAQERFGFGVCRTGRCVEPCGEHGGCRR